MTNKTLSVCMIVKNEEANLGRCLKSVQQVADEIIVVDTGSTDRTKEIAQSYGAIVADHEWDHDFSAARNKSLDLATKDWVLILDADEELEPDEALKIKNLINQETPYCAYYLRLVNIIEGKDIGNAIVLRLYEHAPNHRFRGKLHEQIINCLQDLHGNDCIGQTPIRILHYGYDPQVSDAKKKSRRNLDILLSYEESQKDGYYYYVLGNEYARIDDFDEALRIYFKAVSVTDYKNFSYIYFPYLIMNIAKVLSNARRFHEEVQCLREYERILPYFKDLYFMESLALIECSKLTEAKTALEKYLNCPAGSYEYPCSNFEATYDLFDLRSQLLKGSLPHEPKLLSICIFMEPDMTPESVAEAVKSVNEIAYEVVVVVPKALAEYVAPIKNMGAKITYYDIEMKKFDKKPLKGRYILFMKGNEICSFISQQQILEALEDTDLEAFTLDIFKMQQGTSVSQLRIVKNVKKYKNLEEYEKAVSQGVLAVEDTAIYIHQK